MPIAANDTTIADASASHAFARREEKIFCINNSLRTAPAAVH
jgi:hypothetical protein